MVKSPAYIALTSVVFFFVACQLLFPSNVVLPLDRRVSCLLGSVLCTIIYWALDDNDNAHKYNEVPGSYVDFPVLLILVSIMAVNFVIMRQKGLKWAIGHLQGYIREDSSLGFWMVCFTAFLTSPFITNDGLCLLLVNPVLDAFKDDHSSSPTTGTTTPTQQQQEEEKEEEGDGELSGSPVGGEHDIEHGGREEERSSNSNDGATATSFLRASSYFQRYFGRCSAANINNKKHTSKNNKQKTRCTESDRFYFMLGIACSANIGSSMTFTGNPQNIVIAGYLASLMSGGLFFALLLAPATVCWLLTSAYINYCRIHANNSMAKTCFLLPTSPASTSSSSPSPPAEGSISSRAPALRLKSAVVGASGSTGSRGHGKKDCAAGIAGFDAAQHSNNPKRLAATTTTATISHTTKRGLVRKEGGEKEDADDEDEDEEGVDIDDDDGRSPAPSYKQNPRTPPPRNASTAISSRLLRVSGEVFETSASDDIYDNDNGGDYGGISVPLEDGQSVAAHLTTSCCCCNHDTTTACSGATAARQFSEEEKGELSLSSSRGRSIDIISGRNDSNKNNTSVGSSFSRYPQQQQQQLQFPDHHQLPHMRTTKSTAIPALELTLTSPNLTTTPTLTPVPHCSCGDLEAPATATYPTPYTLSSPSTPGGVTNGAAPLLAPQQGNQEEGDKEEHGSQGYSLLLQDGDRIEDVPLDELGSSSYVTLPLFIAMMVFEFIGLAPLTVIFSFVAVFIVTFALLGNYYCGYPRHVTVRRRILPSISTKDTPKECTENVVCETDEDVGIVPSVDTCDVVAEGGGEGGREGGAEGGVVSIHSRREGKGATSQLSSTSSKKSSSTSSSRDDVKAATKHPGDGSYIALTVTLTNDTRRKLINRYIEELFLDLDYNLLILFSGLFIVSGSFVSTGVPNAIWNIVAGGGGPNSAFLTPASVFFISLYTVIASQLIGNVPLVYMASANISQLDPNTQRFGWIVMAWVSTVAGNFMLTGSAANIIVAEKASRHKTSPVAVTAREHFVVCGLVTAVCIVLGTVVIYLECKGLGYI